MILKNGTVMMPDGDFFRTDLLIKGRIISGFSSNAYEADIFDLTGCRILPGLIDIHNHGYRGHYTLDPDPNSLRALAAELASEGVTSFLPTTTAASLKDLKACLYRLKHFCTEENDGAVARGIYMEGPFLSLDYKGAMIESNMLNPDISLIDNFMKVAGGFLKIISLAPELPEAEDAIHFCVKNGIIPSIAHTASDYEIARRAISAGADHITHLFNAMADPKHREPGVMGALLDSVATAEIICDGHHVHPSFVRMMFHLLGDERMILISDDTPISGLGDGKFVMDGVTSIVKDGVCRLENGTINGNVQPLLYCVLKATELGIPFASAVKMATSAPAKRIGIFSETGSIEVGKNADLLVLDYNNLVKMTVVRGKPVYVCNEWKRDKLQTERWS